MARFNKNAYDGLRGMDAGAAKLFDAKARKKGSSSDDSDSDDDSPQAKARAAAVAAAAPPTRRGSGTQAADARARLEEQMKTTETRAQRPIQCLPRSIDPQRS